MAISDIISTLKSYIGTPYVWGGTSPNGFDCSGLVQYSFAQNGVDLPRTSQEQYAATQKISKDNLQSGDLVFFATDGTGSASHVGVYLGNDQFIQAPRTGDYVKISSLSDAYYSSTFMGGGRISNISDDSSTDNASTNITSSGISAWDFISDPVGNISKYFSSALNSAKTNIISMAIIIGLCIFGFVLFTNSFGGVKFGK